MQTSFAALFREAGINPLELGNELNVDAKLVDQWFAGSCLPPMHIVRALKVIVNLRLKANRVGSEAPINPLDIAAAARPKMVSLFSGAGGLDLGLERAGFKTVLANEIGAHACESLRANKMLASINASEFDSWFDKVVSGQRCYRNSSKPDMALLRRRLAGGMTKNSRPLADAAIIERDVRELSAEDILGTTSTKAGDIDLIAGGAPCQPFSRAGKQKTVDCDDGQLFLEFVRLVDQVRPRWFLFENVKGLVQHRTETLYGTCSECSATYPTSFSLRSAGVEIEQVIDVCASCRRVGTVKTHWEKRRGGSLEMIEAEFSRLGYICSSNVLNARDFGVPQDRDRLFIIGSRDGERFDWPEPTHGARGTARSLFNSKPLADHVSVRDALFQEGHWRYGDLEKSAVLWVKNVVRPHDEPVTWSLDRFAPTVGAHQAAKLAIAPFGVPAEQLARQQWHTLGRRQGDTPPVFVEHEYLTDRELLTLQTFPQHWYLHGTRMERAFQIGNAVPPALAEAVGSSLIAGMEGKRIVTPHLTASV